VGDESVEMLGSVLGSVNVPVGDDYCDTGGIFVGVGAGDAGSFFGLLLLVLLLMLLVLVCLQF